MQDDRAETDGTTAAEAGHRLLTRLRQAAPVLVGIGLFAAGIFALVRLLGPIKMSDVLAGARAMPTSSLLAALGATAAGYAALIGYDWSALRHIGRKLPFPVVAAGGFLGYSLGNTIGISILSGGAVRYRIYSAFGINAMEIAAISTFVALAFGLGISVIGLAALSLRPDALVNVMALPLHQLRLLALVALILVVLVMGWISVTGRGLKLWRFELRAPSPGILLGQLAFTAIDTCAAALALYVLMPQGAPDFLTFLVVYATAVMVGVLSHVPGGLGVFESVVIAALPAGVSVEHAAVALLLFRMIYYLVPFGIAMLAISINEARLASGPIARMMGGVSETMTPVSRAMSGVAPAATGTMVLGLGVYLLLMALMPSVRPDTYYPHDLLSAILLEGGALASAVLGVLMILLAQGLLRRISAAFWLTEAALAAGAVASLANGLDIKSAGLLLVAAAVLWPIRGEFSRAARLTQNLLSPGWFVLIFSILLSAAGFLYLMQENMPYSHEILLRFATDANAPRALRAGLAATALMTFALIYLAMQPARAHSASPDAAALAQAAAIVAKQEAPEAMLALSGDKTFYFSENNDAFIMYGVQGKSWVAYGDPVGPALAVPDLAWAFFDAAYAAGCRPVFYELSERYLPIWVEMGLSVNKIGEEAVIELPAFELEGPARAPLRELRAQALREGISFELLPPPHSAELLAELRRVSDAWLGQMQGREKRFSVGRVDPAYLQRCRIGVARRAGRIVAFANLMETPARRAATIDMLRFGPEAPDGVMEFLFLALIETCRNEGLARFSLGMAPLAGLRTRHGARLWNRFGAVLFKYGGAFYNFAGLRGFKQKFGPDWEPRYLAVPGTLPPLTALRDVTALISGDAEARAERPRRRGGARSTAQ
ncbi:bifunctional lysylphosphatidylglycerol flippase/synthetase MprF [Acidimangrovimonas pyrenivorans]|uniref:Phosphatidylglycerol lysyltransferase n=1 Tax=Acidimangrovimonas pyrenivorans TaxID=2030798 RepID=A0ABV7AL40_9RHOB